MHWRLLYILLFFQSTYAQEKISLADSGKGRFIEFKPVSFYNMFSLNITPVLHIREGDTVSTETIDASGHDKNGVKREKGGNPLTGPFYIDDCRAGDALEIHLVQIKLNRPYAFTTESFVSRSVPDGISKQFKKPRLVKWTLDLKNDIGWPDSSSVDYPHLQNFKVPLNPFLGCFGVAPSAKNNEILSFFQGAFGGNMDFSSIRQSSTVYLPVFHEGGYFFIGDGHALQGDGEIAGNALETSLDVIFTVKVIKQELMQLSSPRVEDSIYFMSVGTAEKLDNALKIATADLITWLKKNYQLSNQEATQVLSTSIEYRIAEIADPEVIVVARIRKDLVKTLIPGKGEVP
jgi:amidase